MKDCTAESKVCVGGECVLNECNSSKPCSTIANGKNQCISGECVLTCELGYHEILGECAMNTDTFCGYEGTAARQCTGSTPYCLAVEEECVECNEDSHCSANSAKTQCNTNTHECVACSKNSDCSVNGSGVCDTENKCYYASCNSGYHVSSDHESCILDIEDCGDINCTDISNVAQTSEGEVDTTRLSCVTVGINKYCNISSCSSGYHVYTPTDDDGNQKEHAQCEANTVSNCGSHGTTCTAGGGQTASCQNGSCVNTCASGYTTCSTDGALVCLKRGDGWNKGSSWNETTCKACVENATCASGQTCDKNDKNYSCS